MINADEGNVNLAEDVFSELRTRYTALVDAKNTKKALRTKL
jgi:hypothetical protein